MDIWNKVKSVLGYQSGDKGVDSYGVDHNGFSLRDELAYQTARNNREQKLIQNYNNQGITENYPQLGTEFWQNSPDNNYGFGTSNIATNIENVTKQWEQNESNTQNFKDNQQSPVRQIVGGAMDMASEYFKMKNHGYQKLDDYHHCKANYNAAARGPYGYNTAKTLGDAKEEFDFYRNQAYKGLSREAAQEDKIHDLSVNADGRLRGSSGLYRNAKEACAKYRSKNSRFPKEYW